MPPQEAPTTIRPEGNSLPSPPAPPRRGPTPLNRDKEASGVGKRERANAGGWGESDPGVQVSVSLQKEGTRSYPWCLGKEWNPEAILVCEETTAMAPEAAPRGPPQDSPQPLPTALFPVKPRASGRRRRRLPRLCTHSALEVVLLYITHVGQALPRTK